MATIEINAVDFPGSALTGSGTDTLKLVGGGVFDFSYATISGFSTIQFDSGDIKISGDQLTGVSSFVGADSYGEIELTGSHIDLTGMTFTGVSSIKVSSDNAVVTVSSLSLGLKLNAWQSQGETIILNGPVSTPASRADLFSRGFDSIVEGQNQWIDAAPTLTGLGGEHLYVRAGDSILLDAEGDSVIADTEGAITYLDIDVSASLYYSDLDNFNIGQNFSIIGDDFHHDQRLLYQGMEIATIDISYLNDNVRLAFNPSATPDMINEFVRTLAFDPGEYVHYQDVTVTLTALDRGGRKAQATIQINAEPEWTPTTPDLRGSTIAENAAAGTVVGTLSATDANDDPVSFTLTDDAGGLFSIQGDKLVYTGRTSLDFETASSYSVTVVATDGQREGQPSTFKIQVMDVVEDHPLYIVGSKGKDKLQGESCSDTIIGGAGNDTLWGGAGADVFIFNSRPNKKANVDRIMDFSTADDSIYLDNKYFTALGKKGTEAHPKALSKSMFYKGLKAHDSNDHIIYNAKTGALYYDPDGTGLKAQIQIATIKPAKLKLTYHDFFVI